MFKLKHLIQQIRRKVSGLIHKEPTVENNNVPIFYTEEQLMARLKFFIGICLSLTLTGIVFVVLYSLIFVQQPLNAISPIDQKFFELIVPIATFLTGTLSGIMLAGNDKDLKAKALEAANKPPPVSPPPASPSSSPMGFGTSQPGFGAVPPMGGFGMTGAGGGFGSGMPVSTPSFSPMMQDPMQAQAWQPQVVAGWGGKKAPVQPPDPEI